MSKDENEFIDPLEEIDPIMREAFTEDDKDATDETESDLDDMLNSLENGTDLDDLSLNDIEIPEETPAPIASAEPEVAYSNPINELPDLDPVSEVLPDLTEVSSEQPESPVLEESPTTIEAPVMEMSDMALDLDEAEIDLESAELEDLVEDLEDDLEEEASYPTPSMPIQPAIAIDEEPIIEQSTSNLASIDFPYLNDTTTPKTTFNPNLFQKIPIGVTVELGRAEVTLKDIYELGEGSIIELRRFAGEQLDLIVNDQVIAKGEVVTIDNKYGLRINEISEQKPHI